MGILLIPNVHQAIKGTILWLLNCDKPEFHVTGQYCNIFIYNVFQISSLLQNAIRTEFLLEKKEKEVCNPLKKDTYALSLLVYSTDTNICIHFFLIDGFVILMMTITLISLH